jgi:peptidoglycan/xylan/chitin deacetylase (PgdA/CDA1 family)
MSQFYIVTNFFRIFFKIIGLIFTKKKHINPITIVTYHSIGQNQKIEMDISFKVFQRQISYFIKNYEIISFANAMKKIENQYFKYEWDGKKKFLVITFDDGYDNFYFNVFPLVQRMKIPIMLFPALEFINNPKKIPLKSSVGKWSAFSPLSRNQLSEINKSEFISIGCHGYKHLDYSKLGEHEIE